jgi:hypothetical protein
MKLTLICLVIAFIPLATGAVYEASRTPDARPVQPLQFRTEPPMPLPLPYESEQDPPQLQILDLTELVRGSSTSEEPRHPANIERLPHRVFTLLADLDEGSLWVLIALGSMVVITWTYACFCWGRLSEQARALENFRATRAARFAAEPS